MIIEKDSLREHILVGYISPNGTKEITGITNISLRRGGSKSPLGIKVEVGTLDISVRNNFDPMSTPDEEFDAGTVVYVEQRGTGKRLFTGRVRTYNANYLLNKSTNVTTVSVSISVIDNAGMLGAARVVGSFLPDQDYFSRVNNLLDGKGIDYSVPVPKTAKLVDSGTDNWRIVYGGGSENAANGTIQFARKTINGQAGIEVQRIAGDPSRPITFEELIPNFVGEFGKTYKVTARFKDMGNSGYQEPPNSEMYNYIDMRSSRTDPGIGPIYKNSIFWVNGTVGRDPNGNPTGNEVYEAEASCYVPYDDVNEQVRIPMRVSTYAVGALAPEGTIAAHYFFYDVRIFEVDETEPVRFSGYDYNSDIATELDVINNSIGTLSWYVNKENLVVMSVNSREDNQVAYFSDIQAPSMVEISSQYDDESIVNYVEAVNIYGQDDERSKVYDNKASILKHGTRSLDITTALLSTNFVTPPKAASARREDLGAPRQSNFDVDNRAQLLINPKGQSVVEEFRWNAQQDIALAFEMEIYDTVRVRFRNKLAVYQIASLKHTITPTRWMVDIGLSMSSIREIPSGSIEIVMPDVEGEDDETEDDGTIG